MLEFASEASLTLETGMRGCFSETSYALVFRCEDRERAWLQLGADRSPPMMVLASHELASSVLLDIFAILEHPEVRYAVRSTTSYYARVHWQGITYRSLPPAEDAEFTASDMESPAGVDVLQAMAREGGALASRASEVLQHSPYARAIELFALVSALCERFGFTPAS